MIYLNDHPPAHVHVFGPGWTIVIDLIELDVREVIGCNETEARRVLRLIAEHHGALLKSWTRLHG